MRARAVVIAAVVLIALIAVYAARRPTLPSKVSTAVTTPLPADDDQRFEAAHVAVCGSIQRVVDGTMVFDREFEIDSMGDGTSTLTTAALIDGRQVDIRAVVRWDDDRQAWTVAEARIGGAAVPIQSEGGR